MNVMTHNGFAWIRFALEIHKEGHAVEKTSTSSVGFFYMPPIGLGNLTLDRQYSHPINCHFSYPWAIRCLPKGRIFDFIPFQFFYSVTKMTCSFWGSVCLQICWFRSGQVSSWGCYGLDRSLWSVTARGWRITEKGGSIKTQLFWC